jgi:glycosyltransferase involved in cell wall biosynthesis
LRIAIVKPDWGIRGGFELVTDRLIRYLLNRDHTVHVLAFDAYRTDHRPFGRRVPDLAWEQAPQYFGYLSQIESCRRLDVRRADVVISTQPPSFFIEHLRHLSLFYHHARTFYELGEYVVRAGLIGFDVQHAAAQSIRTLDNSAFAGVKHFLAGSEAVAERLAAFNGRVDGVSVFHAGPNLERGVPDSSAQVGQFALCVSRHDFPKRTELFVHAARLNGDIPAVSVGVGGRLGQLMDLDNTWTAEGVPDEIADVDLWLHGQPWVDPSGLRPTSSNLRFAGQASDEDLDELYRTCLCVVAPALLEDYGLTVIEAMRHGKPVIACHDGGHLCQFIEDGVNGLLVEPTGKAIAAAIRQLADNPDLAERLGAQARETSMAFTWERAYTEFQNALESVTS